jgi:hypothetical protein
MAIAQPFKSAGSAAVALTTTAQSVLLPSDGENVLVVNTCSVPVACDFQFAAFSATATSPYIVPANSRMLVTIGRVAGTNIPVYAGAFPIGTAASSVYFMRGDGSTY